MNERTSVDGDEDTKNVDCDSQSNQPAHWVVDVDVIQDYRTS